MLSRFISEEEIPSGELRRIICKSYKSFRNEKISPVVSVGELKVMELFHGPTYAFKDVALQLLGWCAARHGFIYTHTHTQAAGVGGRNDSALPPSIHPSVRLFCLCSLLL